MLLTRLRIIKTWSWRHKQIRQTAERSVMNEQEGKHRHRQKEKTNTNAKKRKEVQSLLKFKRCPFRRINKQTNDVIHNLFFLFFLFAFWVFNFNLNVILYANISSTTFFFAVVARLLCSWAFKSRDKQCFVSFFNKLNVSKTMSKFDWSRSLDTLREKLIN